MAQPESVFTRGDGLSRGYATVSRAMIRAAPRATRPRPKRITEAVSRRDLPASSGKKQGTKALLFV